MVNKDLEHHEISDRYEDHHGVIMVDTINAFEVFVSESYGRETSWWLYIDAVDVDIQNGVKMTLSGLIGQPSTGKSTHKVLITPLIC